MVDAVSRGREFAERVLATIDDDGNPRERLELSVKDPKEAYDTATRAIEWLSFAARTITPARTVAARDVLNRLAERAVQIGLMAEFEDEVKPSEVPSAPTPAPRPTVATAIAEQLRERGVDTVYGIAGSTIFPLFGALEQAGIQVVLAQHEGMAAYMAQGHAAATGRLGVVLTTSGPGALNTAHAITAAKQDEVPLLLIHGETDAALKSAAQNGRPTGANLRRVFAPITRSYARLERPEDAAKLVDRAFTAAMQHPRGPVVLSLPVDQQQKPAPEAPRSPPGEPTPPRSTPDTAQVDRVGRALASVKAPPLIYVGVGVRSAQVGQAVLRLAERLGAVVVADPAGKAALPHDHPQFLGNMGAGQSEAVTRYLRDQKVGAVIVIGAALNELGDGHKLPATDGPTVRIDHDAERLWTGPHFEHRMAGDLELLLNELNNRLAPSGVTASPPPAGVRSISPPLQSKGGDSLERARGRPPFRPQDVAATVAHNWPNATVVSDIGAHMLAAIEAVPNRAGTNVPPGSAPGSVRNFDVRTGLAGMTSGIGVALGRAQAGDEVVCICGDGGVLMAGHELTTAVRYAIPISFVVFADGRYAMVDRVAAPPGGALPHYNQLPQANIAALARAQGVRVIQVESLEEVQPVRDGQGPVLYVVPVASRA